MFIPPTTEEIYTNLVQRLKDEAGLTVDSNSSVISALTLGFSSILQNLYSQLSDIDRSSNLDLAVGSELDRLGVFLGLSRQTARRATTAGYGPAVVFRNASNLAVTVPQGTLIFPASNPSILYRVISTVVAPSNGIATVDVEAAGSGPEYNLSQYSLNAHNLGISDLTCYNPRAITSGSDQESDESYRSRLYKSSTLQDPSSRDSIRQNLSALPGVSEAQVIEGTSGPGTFEVLLIGTLGQPPRESIYEALNYLSDHAPLGIKYRVTTPTLVFVDVIIKLVLSASNESKRSSIATGISQSISTYIESLPVEDGSGNGVITYSSLLTEVALSSIDLKDYTIDLSVDGRPIIFGSNVGLDLREKFTARKVIVR